MDYIPPKNIRDMFIPRTYEKIKLKKQKEFISEL